MKILQVVDFYKPSWEAGGITRVCYEISSRLANRGHEVTVYAMDGFKTRLDVPKNKPVDVDGIPTYYFRNISNLLTRNNFYTPYFLPFIAKKDLKKFDVIHVHTYRSPMAIFVCYYARKYKIPYVLQAHGSVPRIIEKKGLKYLFDIFFGYKILKDASKMIAVSNVEVNQYIKMGVPKEKIIVISNGIDVDSFSDLPEKGTFRKQYGISEKYIVLFLGRLHEIKGIDFLIESYAELKKEQDDVVLVLAGSDDGYKDKAEILINELNLKNEVRFIGHIGGADKLAAYVDADVLVYPSIFEIFGLVPFEAVMCGTPIIVTDDCGCGDLVRDANCGHLIKYGNVNDLKDKIKHSIENHDDGHRMGEKFVNENLDWGNLIKEIESTYESCD